MYIMQHTNDRKDFNKNYFKYTDGFGNPGADHWLGLEKIHLLTTSRAYELQVLIKPQNNTSYSQKYKHFQVSNADSGYRLSFDSSVTGTLGDCFTPLKGAIFRQVTYDNDQDESVSVNCADKHQGGFWFRGDTCSTCNPTGPLTLPADGLRSGVDNEAFWTENLGNVAPFKIYMFLVPL
nr:hypothetical protein BaRGS_027746 [Batillaria attramentaria]